MDLPSCMEATVVVRVCAPSLTSSTLQMTALNYQLNQGARDAVHHVAPCSTCTCRRPSCAIASLVRGDVNGFVPDCVKARLRRNCPIGAGGSTPLLDVEAATVSDR